tara:strand:- start:2266 stop:2571 length:306 start_codon:yes stop_codon:yes gene_type:complete
MDSKNEKLFDLFFEKEFERGKGGVMFIKGNEYSYLFSREFPSKDFATKLQDVLDEDEEKNIFFVLEQNQQLHIMSYSREKIMFSRASNALTNAITNPETSD